MNGSLIAADETQPTISTIFFEYAPGPGNDSTYQEGDRVGVLVRFSEGVEVYTVSTEEADGTEGYLAPQLELNIGGVAKTPEYGLLMDGPSRHLLVEQRAALELIFGYVVQEGDVDSDGISIAENSISLNSGTIQDEAGNDATLTHDALAADSEHEVDGAGPTVDSVSVTSQPGTDSTYGVGDRIQVTVKFSEVVTVTGAPQLELDMYEFNPSAR